MYAHQRRSAFSLIELVIVIVIIGIIGAIAIPRMSRGASGASESSLRANLSLLRNGVDLFHTEHSGTYPTYANIVDALTKFSDEAGTTFSATKTAACIYGPYIRTIPPLPVGADKGKTSFANKTYTAGNGWIYDDATGDVKANCSATEKDGAGNLFSGY
jgi:general secretion pathway protein G